MIMGYRTKTYIAADWDGDRDAVEQLYKWNNSNYWSLDFHDAHDLTQARDSSLNCSIKSSLATRLDASKTFVLIVGDNTKTVRSGSCQYCNSKNSWTGACARGYSVDNRSYIEYECEKAVHDRLKIVVLYNAITVDKSKCPDAVKNTGTHKEMKTINIKTWSFDWNYQAVKSALDQ
jgi:hypothetical protein